MTSEDDAIDDAELRTSAGFMINAVEGQSVVDAAKVYRKLYNAAKEDAAMVRKRLADTIAECDNMREELEAMYDQKLAEIQKEMAFMRSMVATPGLMLCKVCKSIETADGPVCLACQSVGWEGK